jgi:hypothetical protein
MLENNMCCECAGFRGIVETWLHNDGPFSSLKIQVNAI